jgi:hypothetical protein
MPKARVQPQEDTDPALHHGGTSPQPVNRSHQAAQTTANASERAGQYNARSEAAMNPG